MYLYYYYITTKSSCLHTEQVFKIIFNKLKIFYCVISRDRKRHWKIYLKLM